MSDLIVVKIGGAAGIDHAGVCDDVAALAGAGAPVIVVHGGSNDASEVAERMGHPPVFITSPSGHVSRRTDAATIDIFTMVCCGMVNKRIVRSLVERGVNAIGLSGIDGRLWEGRRKKAVRSVEDGRSVVIRDDFTGRVERVNTDLLGLLLETGHVPVLSPPAISDEHEPINVDADRAAAQTASGMRAGTLCLLSNVPGLLADFPDPASLIREVPRSDLVGAEGAAQGRMKKKVLAAREALEGGVPRVVIGDANGASPLRDALAGAGTVFT